MNEATMFLDVEVDGTVVDVAVADGRVVAVGPDLPRPAGSAVVRGAGGALLPGLHDHHVHLLAMAAAEGSVDLRLVADAQAFDRALRAAGDGEGPGSVDAARAPGTAGSSRTSAGAAVASRSDPSAGWQRVVGYDERHGALDRWRLDALAPGVAVRVQHRSGAAWVLSTAALLELDLLDTAPDGWVHRRDGDLGSLWPRVDPTPGLAPVAARLAARGVTGVTDATPFTDLDGLTLLAAAHRRGELPQRVMATGGAELASEPTPHGLLRGPVKVIVTDHDLPTPEALVAAFLRARRAGRAVAVHCVTRVGLVLALAAWEQVGVEPGDRIEHGAVIPEELVEGIGALGLQVVTQPGFVAERGDRYLAEVDADDRPHLYRCGSLRRAGVAVAGSTDAPFGLEDVWAAMRAAIDRRSPSGAVLGADEILAPLDALGLFLAPLGDPGGAPRRIAPGVVADLCLLDAPLSSVLEDLSAERVRATWVEGRLVTPAL